MPCTESQAARKVAHHPPAGSCAEWGTGAGSQLVIAGCTVFCNEKLLHRPHLPGDTRDGVLIYDAAAAADDVDTHCGGSQLDHIPDHNIADNSG